MSLLGVLVHVSEKDEQHFVPPPMLPQWVRRAFASLFRRQEQLKP